MAAGGWDRTAPPPVHRRMSYPTLNRYALLAGLCALVPLPFVDQLLRRQVLKRAYGDLAEAAGVDLPPDAHKELLRERSNLLLGCLIAVVWWPIKKLFRTVIFVLLVKDALDWVAEAAVRIRMVQEALDRGLLPAHATAVSDAMDASVRAEVGSPVWRGLRGRSGPDVDWEAAPNPLSGLQRELVSHAGGALALAAFRERMGPIGSEE